jgi:hypothetical protein
MQPAIHIPCNSNFYTKSRLRTQLHTQFVVHGAEDHDKLENLFFYFSFYFMANLNGAVDRCAL